MGNGRENANFYIDNNAFHSIIHTASFWAEHDPLINISSYREQLSIANVVTFFERQNIFFTKTMIQNYVRVGVLPPLVNKRYYVRNHLYMLVLIELLKDTYPLDVIKRLFEPYYDNLEPVYKDFIKMYQSVMNQWKDNLNEIQHNLKDDGENAFTLLKLLMVTASSSKLLSDITIETISINNPNTNYE